MCLYKKDSEYALGSKYSKILNMAKFLIWQGSQYESVLNIPEYALTEFSILGCKYTRILNMAGL